MESGHVKIEVLDCTLRDGSYLLDYQITARETFLLSSALAASNIPYIEVGHGTGLGSSSDPGARAAESDRVYIGAAAEGVASSKSKLGVFFIPTIGNASDLRTTASLGLDFVRIGTNVDDVNSAIPYIQLARELGLEVFCNLMKSYSIAPNLLTKQAEIAVNAGADVVVIVDSAGCMLPEEVAQYTRSIRDAVDCRIGYHGHNNLGLAAANSIAAAQNGASIIDSTIQGMGRSAGNAQTEIMVHLFAEYGYHTGIDLLDVLDVGKRLVRPMMKDKSGIDDFSVTMGAGRFHSSYLKKVLELTRDQDVDVREVMLKLRDIEQIELTDRDIVQAIHSCGRISKAGRSHVIPEKISSGQLRKIHIADDRDSTLKKLITASAKRGSRMAVAITLKPQQEMSYSTIREFGGYQILCIECGSKRDVEDSIRFFDAKVEHILFDMDTPEMRALRWETSLTSAVSLYSEEKILLNSISVHLKNIEKPGTGILVLGHKHQQGVLTLLEKYPLSVVTRANIENSVAMELVLILDSTDKVSLLENLDKLASRCKVLIADDQIFTCHEIQKILDEDAIPQRLDMRTATGSEIAMAIQLSRDLSVSGKKNVNGVLMVSGGFFECRGDIIVDSIVQPSCVLGISDGQGGFLAEADSEQFHQNLKNIEEFILAGM